MTEERIRELIAESIDAFGKKILAEIDSRIGELKSEKKRIYEARRFKNRPWWADDAHEKDRVHEIKILASISDRIRKAMTDGPQSIP